MSMNVHETTVLALGVLLVVIPAGLSLATVIYENKLKRQHREFMESQENIITECSECCGCMSCVEPEECGCCGKPLHECECKCGCHKH